MSLRDNALSINWQETKEFPTPEISISNGLFFLRKITSFEKGKMHKLAGYDPVTGFLDSERAPTASCLMYLSDRDGNRIFGDGDFDAVGNLPATLVERIWIEGSKFNGLSETSIEDAEKNSGTTPRNNSGTD